MVGGVYPSATDALRAAHFMVKNDRKFRGWDYYGTVLSLVPSDRSMEMAARVTAMAQFGDWMVAARIVESHEQFSVADALLDTACALATLYHAGHAFPELPLTVFSRGDYFAWPEGKSIGGVVVRKGSQVAARLVRSEDVGDLMAFQIKALDAFRKFHAAVQQDNPALVDEIERVAWPEWITAPGLDPLDTPELRRVLGSQTLDGKGENGENPTAI